MKSFFPSRDREGALVPIFPGHPELRGRNRSAARLETLRTAPAISAWRGKWAEPFLSMARASQVGQAVLACPPALH
jgi:hypothetical protein